MSEIETTPQKFSFEEPSIIDARGNIRSSGIRITTELDAFRADRRMIKKNLEFMPAEVLDYFETDEGEKEQKEDRKHKTLLYLGDLQVGENKHINEYTLEEKRDCPKEGFEKKWRQAAGRSDMLIKIIKLIQHETKALSIPERREMKDVVETILSELTTAYIKGVAESAEIAIISAIKRRILVNLEIRVSPNGCLMIDGYHFLTGSDK